MHFNRFDLNLLVALDALLEEKNVTRASERLFMSQPAMSGALQRLRERFNDPLLIRVGRTMELTPRAAALTAPVREILLQIQNTIDTEPEFDPSTARRSFTVLMSDYVATVLVPEVIRRISSRAPGIKIQVAMLGGGAHERLETGRADLMIRALVDPKSESTLVSENLNVDELFADDWVCVADAKRPDIGDELTLEAYTSLPHVSHDFGRRVPTLEEISHAQISLDLDIRAAAPNFSTLVFMVPGTDLLALIPRRLARTLSRNVDVRVLEPPVDFPPLNEVLIWHKRHEFDAGHCWLRDVFRETASELL